VRRDSYESQVEELPRLDPVGMLDAQGVVDLLLESNVRVHFVRHANGSVKSQIVRGAQRLH
jgi:hypothetical protein